MPKGIIMIAMSTASTPDTIVSKTCACPEQPVFKWHSQTRRGLSYAAALADATDSQQLRDKELQALCGCISASPAWHAM